MRCFSIDLSTQIASVAIVHNDTAQIFESWDQKSVPRQYVFVRLASLFSKPAYQPESIDQFVVGLGPGSFSGIRTAIALVTGLAMPGNKPVGGISGAESLASDILLESQNPKVVIVGDARRQHLWAARYCYKNGCVVPLMKCTLFTHESFRKNCLNTDLLVSPDFNRLEKFLRDMSKEGLQIIPEPRYPQAKAIARIALRRIRDNILLDPLKPLYLHPPVFTTPQKK